MSHNIEHATHAASRVDDYVAPVFGRPGSDIPVVGDNATNPVLTVASNHYSPDQREVSFLFYEGFDAANLVVNPWTDSAVHLVGEDLFALRELLNEMPEYAFTRPADPVVKPEPSPWVRGDLVIFDASHIVVTYLRGDEEWKRTSTQSRKANSTRSDETIQDLVDTGRYSVIRKGGVML